jgi:DNA-binding NarL/FixJ family response regulator
LTGRELQIVAAVLNGKTNKEIAHELDIASKTVEWHLARVFARMNVSSRAELAVRAERGGWLQSLDDQE